MYTQASVINSLKGRYELYDPKIYKDKKVTPDTEVDHMYPGYFFISLCDEHDDWSLINRTPGVKYLLERNRPVPIDDDFVEFIKAREDQDEMITVYSDYSRGDVLRIKSGPYLGYMAEYLSPDKQTRINALIRLTNGSTVRANMKKQDVEPAA